MPHCPRCRTNYPEGSEVCWPCQVPLVAGTLDDEEASDSDRPTWTPLKVVYLAPDEFNALRIKTVLEEAGLDARVESAQIPWVDGIMSNIKGYWGRVLVPPDEYEAGKEIVNDYLASLGDG